MRDTLIRLKLNKVGKSFAHGKRVVDDLTLAVAAGECLALVGPSGCGKTTLLRLIAGLEHVSAGSIELHGKVVSVAGGLHVPCDRRDVAMLFQRPALIPSDTVQQNLLWDRSIRHPLRAISRLLGKDNGLAEAVKIARTLGLESELDRPVGQLSGGQQQRTALGRCLMREAKLWLFDEPLGHLDAPLRGELRRQIRWLARETGATLVFVTHDPAEAFAIGDRVAVMDEGRIIQADEPAQLVRRPQHRLVAELVQHGRCGMNLITGEAVADGDNWHVVSPAGQWLQPRPTSEASEAHSFNDVNFSQRAKKLDGNAEKLHIIIGVVVDDVVCAGRSPSAKDNESMQITVAFEQREYGPAGEYLIGRDTRGQRIVGRASDPEQCMAGEEMVMMFSTRQTFGFDGTTGATLWVPAG